MKYELLERLERASALAKRTKYCALYLSEEETEKAFSEFIAYCRKLEEKQEKHGKSVSMC